MYGHHSPIFSLSPSPLPLYFLPFSASSFFDSYIARSTSGSKPAISISLFTKVLCWIFWFLYTSRAWASTSCSSSEMASSAKKASTVAKERPLGNKS